MQFFFELLLILLWLTAVALSLSSPRELLFPSELQPVSPPRLLPSAKGLDAEHAQWRPPPITILEAVATRLRRQNSEHRNSNHEVDSSVNSSCSSSADVHALLDKIVCAQKYLNSIIQASKRCNLFGYFDTDHIRSCGLDANGTYCRKHERNFPDPDYLAWNVLQQCSLQTRSGTCSSSCKWALRNFAGKFGCCIHVSRVSWFVEDNPHILILSPALWTYCGLSRPNPCGNVPTLPSSTIAGSCTYGCYAYARSALICDGIGSELIDTYKGCGRKGAALELTQLCGVNEKGTACFELQFSDNTDYLLSVYTSCFKYFSSGVCTESCRRDLVRFRSKYGCCVNVYNGTAFGESSQLLGSIVTQYDLWSRCGVDSPGMCTLPTGIGNFTYDVEAFCDRILIDGGSAITISYLLYIALLLSYSMLMD